MHFPRNPPKIDIILSDEQKSKAVLSEEIKEFAKDFNKKYLHWSEVRTRDTGPFDPDTVWARMKLVRMDNSNTLVFGKTHYRYLISDRAVKMLHEFDMRMSVGSFPDAMDPHRKSYYSISSLMEESIASSQMEGAITTTKKAKEMLCKNARPKDKSERMIVNNYKAIRFIKDQTEQPLTLELIKSIHRIVTEGTLDERYMGIFRDNDDVVVQDPSSGEVFHQPIPMNEIESAMQQLCDFINDEGESLHPVIKGIILHYAIAYIHPFEDGNGRVARTLFYWYELKSGYRSMEYLALSRYIKDHKGKYEESYVFGETDGNDMTYFIHYNLKALMDSLDKFEDYLKRKIGEERSTMIELFSHGLNDRQIRIINGLMGGGTVTVRSIQNQNQVSLNTARADIRHLIEAGLLIEAGREVNMKVYSWSGKKV
ncbi:Fic family protein [Candidatus Methanarcanum hacksteinii]|uniref:Fic family protein n=1 Tax=Candidatus Methanarcanum hacksteinii TaxID=2911857 RepID=UPI0037DCA1EE